MVLILVGLGLSGVESVTARGDDVIRTADTVFLESYTSVLMGPDGSKEYLEEFYHRPICMADRQLVEDGADKILSGAVDKMVAFLVVGDPLCSTTHTDLILRAVELNIPWEVVPNASIISAIAVTGLQIYRFGEVVSIPFWTDSWCPTSFMEKVAKNFDRGLHTLCLLDIKIGEVSIENLMRGRRDVREPPRFMTVQVACAQIVKALSEMGDTGLLKASSLAVAACRLGRSRESTILTASIQEFADDNTDSFHLGPPLHSLVIAADELHPLEAQMLLSSPHQASLSAKSALKHILNVGSS